MSATSAVITASDIDRQEWPGMGSLGFIADSGDRILGDLFFAPGDGFNFHHHPNQEEVLYMSEGSVEAWVEREKRTIVAGDALVLPAGLVHACFNVSDEVAKMVVVLSPKIETEELGFELVDVSGDEPWASAR